MKPVAASRTGKKEKTILILILTGCVMVHACKKTDTPRIPQPPDPPTTRVGQLKEMAVQSLPSPLYHFEYNDSGIATGIDFASGFIIYKLSYGDGRLLKMVNQFNQNTMVYHYTNGLLSNIRDVRPNNTATWNYTFSYNSDQQIKEIRWYQINNLGTDSFVYRKVLLLYRLDGNLMRYDDYRNTTGLLEWVQAEEFMDFDKGKNVDDFGLLKEFQDNLLYLPNTRLMVNNPRSVLITGPQNDFEVIYTWQYENGLPVQKQMKITQIRGNAVGLQVVGNTRYSYY